MSLAARRSLSRSFGAKLAQDLGGQPVGHGVQTNGAALALEPRQLPLGELPRREDRALHRFVAIVRTREMLPELPVTDAAHRRQLRIEIAAVAQSPDFLEEALLHHQVQA